MPPRKASNTEPDPKRIPTRAKNAESHPGDVVKPKPRRAPGVAQQEKQEKREAKEKKEKDKQEKAELIERRVEEYCDCQQAALAKVEKTMPRQKSKGTLQRLCPDNLS